MKTDLTHRMFYAAAAFVVILVGLATRSCPQYFHPFLTEYAGDVLWGLMMFLLVSTLLAACPAWKRATVALALAFGVEFSQLYRAPWIDSIRHTTLGALVLGHGFLWSDLVCYAVGILMGSCAEYAIRHFSAVPET